MRQHTVAVAVDVSFEKYPSRRHLQAGGGFPLWLVCEAWHPMSRF